MFHWLRWHLAKMQLTQQSTPPPHIELSLVQHDARVEDFPPTTASYGRLAHLWNRYASWFVPRYGRFLAAAAKIHCYPVESALDLACGTGLLTRDLATHIPRVMGLDRSEAMLRRAQACPADGLHFVEGDFRDFDLGQSFHAVVCGTDSLNYVQRPDELAAVFRCVGRQLLPGGFFVFDVYDETYFRARAQTMMVAVVGNQLFESYLFYDAESRVGEYRLVFPDAIEAHRRIPIETSDVREAATAAGLAVTDQFSCRTYLAIPPPVRQFYVLRKT